MLANRGEESSRRNAGRGRGSSHRRLLDHSRTLPQGDRRARPAFRRQLGVATITPAGWTVRYNGASFCNAKLRGRDQRRQLLPRVEHARLYRGLGDADYFGNLFDGFAVIVNQVDDLAVLR